MRDKTGRPENIMLEQRNFYDLECRARFIPNGSIVDAKLEDSYVKESLFDAHTILYATTDDTPVALTVNEQTLVGRLTGGNISAVAIGIADNNIVQIDQADIASGDWGKFTAAGLSGRSDAQVRSDLSLYTQAEVDSAIDTDVATHAALTTGVHGAGASTLATVANIATHAALTASHGVSGAIVGTTDSQVLTNKTLTSPTINGTIATTGLTLPAFTLGGALTLNGQAFEAGANWGVIDTTTSPNGLAIRNTNNDGEGPRLLLEHISVSPAIDDVVGALYFIGRDSGANITEYSVIRAKLVNVTDTTEEALDEFWVSVGGGLNLAMTLTGAGLLWLDVGVNVDEYYQVASTQVLGAQGAAVADATDAASVILRLNELLARCRAHGLIAT